MFYVLEFCYHRFTWTWYTLGFINVQHWAGAVLIMQVQQSSNFGSINGFPRLKFHALRCAKLSFSLYSAEVLLWIGSHLLFRVHQSCTVCFSDLFSQYESSTSPRARRPAFLVFTASFIGPGVVLPDSNWRHNFNDCNHCLLHHSVWSFYWFCSCPFFTLLGSWLDNTIELFKFLQLRPTKGWKPETETDALLIVFSEVIWDFWARYHFFRSFSPLSLLVWLFPQFVASSLHSDCERHSHASRFPPFNWFLSGTFLKISKPFPSFFFNTISSDQSATSIVIVSYFEIPLSWSSVFDYMRDNYITFQKRKLDGG